MVVAVMAVAVERRVGAGPQHRRADRPADFVVRERRQKPASSGVCRFHLERAIGLARMADDLVRHQRIEMRIGNHDDFADRAA